MPHFTRARLTLKSLSPCLMTPRISFLRESGRIRRRSDSIVSRSQSSYAERRKKKFSSSVHSQGRSWSGQTLSGWRSSSSSLKPSQRGQYQPLYFPR